MENLNKYMSYIYIYIQKYYRPFKKQLKLCLNLSLMITILPINVFIVGRLAKTAMNTSTIISHLLHVRRLKLNYILLNIHRKMDFLLSNAVALWSPLMVHLNTKEKYITSLQSQNITCSKVFQAPNSKSFHINEKDHKGDNWSLWDAQENWTRDWPLCIYGHTLLTVIH